MSSSRVSVARRFFAGLVVLALTVVMPSTAQAYERPTAAFSGGVGTMPGSGLTQTWAAGGATSLTGPFTTVGSREQAAGQYAPDLAGTAPTQNVTTNTGTCAVSGTCSGLGTLTVTFPQPVLNPVIHFAGLGGQSSTTQGGTTIAASVFHATLTLTTPGLSLSKVGTGANYRVANGQTITAENDSTSVNCQSVTTTAAATAACGSARVNGLVSTATFSMGAEYVATVGGGVNGATSGDAFFVLATTDQDFGDGPASYDGADAARSVVGDLRLGTAVTADATNTPNATTSPLASASAANDAGDDGVTMTPIVSTQTSYSRTVALSGASAPAQVCGWIDFNRNGTYESGERACAPVAAGQTSATLSWTGLTGLVTGTSYARFRVGYTSAATSPRGAGQVGEVEDHQVQIVPPAPPVATDDTATTPQNTDVTVPVVDNDTSDPTVTLDASSVRLLDPADGTYKTSVTIPGEGTYTVDTTTGAVTFDPVADFTGTSTVTYRVADSTGATDTATLEVAVTPVVPDLQDDTVTVPYDEPSVVDVLDNDSPGAANAPLDPSSVVLLDPATGEYATSVTIPGEGTYTVDPTTGAVTFDPIPTFFGEATPVEYRVTDANGTDATATLTLTVAEPDASVANPDTASTLQDEPVTLSPVANDTSADGVTLDPTSVRLLDEAGDPVTSLTVDGEGTWTVDPATGDVTFDPEPGFTGDATPVTYQVTDSAGRDVTSTLEVSVTAVTPDVQPDSASTPYLTPVTVPVLGNDTAGDPSAPLVVDSVELQDPDTGEWVTSLTVDGVGTYEVQPDGQVVFTPAEGFEGTADPVTYRVADDNGTFGESTLTVTVGQAPVATDDTGETIQDEPVTVPVLANDAPGTDATLDPASVVLLDPADGTYKDTVTVDGVGTWTVDPATGDVTFDPEPQYTGTAALTYQVTDSDGNTATATVTVEVAAVTPTAAPDTANTPYETPVTVPVLANDAAGDPTAPLDPTSVRLQDPATGDWVTSVTIAGEGTYTVDPATGAVRFVPVQGFTGTGTELDYRVADDNGTLVTSTVQVTVANPDLPVASPDTGVTVQDEPVTVNPLTNDTADPRAPLQPGTLQLLDPADGTYKSSVSTDEGTWTVVGGRVVFDPAPTFTGDAVISYRVEDEAGQVAASTITITVEPVTPVAQPDEASTPFQTPVSIPLLQNDSAGDPSAPLVVDSVQLQDPATGEWATSVTTAEGTWTVNPATGAVLFEPADGFEGTTQALPYRVADDNGTFAESTVTVLVGDAPVAVDDTASTIQDEPVSVDVIGNDTPGTGATLDPESVVLVDPADGSLATSVTVDGVGTWTVDTSTGEITFDPEPQYTGTADIDYVVTDSDGNTASATLSVEVVPVTPTAAPDTATTGFQQLVTVPVLANDTAGDPSAPLDPTTVQLRDPDTGDWVTSVTIDGEGTYTVTSSGTVDFAPDPDFTGDGTQLDYRVADDNGTFATSTLQVTVSLPDAPVANPDFGTTIQDEPVTVPTLANDVADDRTTLQPDTVLLLDPADGTYKDTVTVAGVGTWTVDPATGDVTFDPEPAFSGDATVGYRVEDGTGQVATSQVTVTVDPVEPVAAPDNAETPFATPTSVDLLANDVAGDPTAPLDPTSVQLQDPATGEWVTTLTTTAGTWVVNPDGSVDFTPADGFSGTSVALPYRVADDNGTFAEATVTVTVGEAPEGVDDEATVIQGSPVTVDPLANDTPGTGATFDPPTVALLDPADETYKDTVTVDGVGTWVVNPDGTVTFTPEPTYTGEASIGYLVTDSTNLTTTATITVTVTEVVPVLTEDLDTTPYETPVTVPLLANDEPGDPTVPLDPATTQLRDPATGAWVTTLTTSEGTWVIDTATGDVTFTPAQGFTGTTRPIAYRVADENGTYERSTVTVLVETPDVPVALPDSTSTIQDEPVTLTPLANDTSDDRAPLVTGSLLLLDPADGRFKGSVTVPGVGTWTVNPTTGVVTFDPVPTYTGNATISYRVADEAGQVTTSTMTVTVTPVTPVLTADEEFTPYDTPVNVPVLANDSAGDPTAPLVVGSVRLQDPATGTWVTSVTTAEGTWRVNVTDGSVTFTPADGYSGTTPPLTYRVADGNGTTATSTVTVTVGEPPQALDDTASTIQNEPVVFDPLANDTPGTDASFVPPVVRLVDPADGQQKSVVTVAGVGTWTFDPDTGFVTFDPVPTFVGDASIDYVVVDTDGNTATATMTASVAAVTPVAQPDEEYTPFETPVRVPVLANDEPGDESAPLVPSTVRLQDPGTGGWVRSVATDEGTWTVDTTTGEVVFTPAAGYTGTTPPLTYRVADDNGTYTSSTVTVEVGAAPVARDDTASTIQDEPVTLDPIANDEPGQRATFEPDAVQLLDPDSGLPTDAVTVAGVGTWTLLDDGRVTFDPEPQYTGTATLDYVVTDSDGNTATATLSVEVTPVTPVLAADTETTPYLTPVTVDVLANDAPGDASAPLDPSTVQLLDPATGDWVTELVVDGVGTWTVDPDTGAVTFAPVAGFEGETPAVTYRVADDNGTFAQSTVTVTVGDAPVAEDDATSTLQDEPVTFDPLVNDTPGTDATFDTSTLVLIDPADGSTTTVVTVPGVGLWSTENGLVTFDPEPGFTGDAVLDYVVTDTDGNPASATMTVTVTPVTPVAAPDSETTPYETPVTVDVLANDTPGDASAPLDPSTVELYDAANDTWVTSLTVDGEGTYTVDPDTGAVTFTPEELFTGPGSLLTYRVADDNGTPTQSTLQVTVALPDPPTAAPDTDTTVQGVAVTVDALANDTAGERSALVPGSVELLDPADTTWKDSVTVAGVGTWSVDPATGAVTFAPEPTFTGEAVIAYRVQDEVGQTVASTVTVDVTPVVPLPADDTAATPYLTPVTVDVLANDEPGAPTAPLDPSTVELYDAANDTWVTSLTVDGEGTYTVDPDTGEVTFEPADGFEGAATPVAYRVADANGTFAEASLTVTVGDAPVAADDAATTIQDEPVTLEPAANDTPGTGATIDATTVRLLDPATGDPVTEVVVDGEGTWSVDTATGVVTFDPEPGFTGDASLDYEVTDSDGNTASATMTVTVEPVVPVARPDGRSTPFATPVDVDVLVNDTEGDASAPLDPSTVELYDAANDAWVTELVVDGVGTYTVDPDSGVVTFAPADGYEGTTDPVTYRVADDNGTLAESTLTVTVGDAPFATQDVGTTLQDEPVTVDTLGNDTPGTDATFDPATVAVLDPADGTYKDSVTVDGVGTWTVDPTTGAVTFDPEPQYTGTATVEYRVTDTDGNTATSSVLVTVTPVTPVADPDRETTPYETPATVDVLGNDTPGDPSAPLDPSTVELYDAANDAWVTELTVDGEGTYTVDPDTGAVTFTPEELFTGPGSLLTYRVADDNGTSTQSTLQVTVALPAAPVANPDAGTTLQDEPVTVATLGNDTAGDGSALLPGTVQLLDPADSVWKDSVTVDGVGTWTVDPTTGAVTFDPVPSFTGEAAVAYRVQDEVGQVAASTVTVTVQPVTPVAVDDSARTPFSTPVDVPVLGNDTAGDDTAPLDPTTVELYDAVNDTWVTELTVDGEGTYTVDPDTGVVTFTPVDGFEGATTPVDYRVADDNGTLARASLTVSVGDAPVAADDTATTPQGQAVPVPLLGNDTPGSDATLVPGSVVLVDPDSGERVTTLTVDGEGTWTVDPTTGGVVFTPEPEFTGTTTPVDYEVTDTDGNTASASVSVEVTPVTPVASDDSATTPYLTPVTIPVLGNDVAGDPDVPLVPSSLRLLDPATDTWVTTVTVDGVGTWTVEDDGSVTFTPAEGFSGTAPAVDYRVADANGTYARASLTVVVGAPTGAEAAPNTVTGQPGQPVTLYPLRNDSPSAGATWDASTLQLQDPATGEWGSTVTVAGVGTWVVNDDGSVTFTPVDGFSGTATIPYRVTDTAGVTVSSTLTVEIPAVAAPPMAGPGRLAQTGSDPTALAGLGLLLLLTGLGAVLAARRTRDRLQG